VNNGRFGPFLITLVTVLIATYVSVSVLLDSGNTVGSLLFYIMVAAGMLGALAPRFSLLLLVVQFGLLDGVKRLMVVAGQVEQIDLFWVLGIAPVTLAGISGGILIRLMTRQISANQSDWKRLGVVALVNGGLVAMLLISGAGIGGSLREIANGTLYSMLIFVVPLLYRTTAEIAGLLRFITLFFVPIAIYGVYQQVYGFLDYEIAYLKTGLSIEIKQLEAGRVRSFSTLNSPTAFGSVCGMLGAFTMLMAGYRSSTGRSILPPWIAAFCCVCFLVGLVAATSRSEFLILPVVAAATWAFPHPGRTKVVYAVGITSFLALVITSPWILARLDIYNRMMAGQYQEGSFMALISAVGSYSDRLRGFSEVLMNPAAWSLLGIARGDNTGDYLVHDPISYVLLYYGVVGLAFTLIGAILALKVVHLLLSKIQSPYGKRLCSTLLGLGVAIGMVSMISGSRFAVFPVNGFVWLFVGCLLVIVEHEKRALAERELAATAEDDEEAVMREESPLLVGGSTVKLRTRRPSRLPNELIQPLGSSTSFRH
jgi:hypothetical protein